MAADPNWLLSAVAQSTAALVAIIGGLIATRVINLRSERSGLTRRRDELQTRIQSLEHEAEKDREWLVARAARRAISDWINVLWETNGNADDEDLLDANRARGWLHTDLKPHIDALRSTFDSALTSVREHLDQADSPLEVESDDLPTEDLEPEQRNVYERILELEQDKIRRRSDIYGISRMVTGDYSSIVPATEVQRLNDHEDQYVEDLETIRRYEAQLDLLHQQLDDIQEPPDLRWAFWILGYLTIVGIALPLTLMATLPTTLHWGWRTAVVTLVLAGIAALAAYLAHFAQRATDQQ